MHDFDWFAEHLTVAIWNDKAPGSRDVMTNCPVHGGSDSLHITEKNGRALVAPCFACGAKYAEVIAAIDGDEPEEAQSASAPEEQAGPVVIRRKRRTAAEVSASVEQSSDPMQWYADYCGVSLDWLEANIPVRATADGWLAHYWPGTSITKDRQTASSERRWTPKGANPPRLWPAISDPLPPEIWLCEGESDVICLRAAGMDCAYTAGSATTLLTAEEMRALKHRGVERIVVAYDNDKAGQKATAEVLKTAREARLSASVAKLGDPLMGGPKDWRDRYVSGDHSIPKAGTPDWDDIYALRDVAAAVDTAFLLDRLHPAAHTILFGDGGTGKGVLAAWWAARLARDEGMKVLIIDYEQNATHEWRPRIEAFGGKKILDSVFIWQPSDAIWDIAADVRQAVLDFAIDYVMVDSVTYACVGQEVEKSTTATMYSLAVAQFGVPVLSLAHTTKTEPDKAKWPFGSVFWSNGARVTIRMSLTGEYDEPRKIECIKTNQRSPFAPSEIDWDWVDSDLPGTLAEHGATPQATDRLTATMLGAAMLGIGRHGTLDQIVSQLYANGWQPKTKTPKQAVSNALRKASPTIVFDSAKNEWRLA